MATSENGAVPPGALIKRADRDKLEQMFRLSTQRRAAFDKKLP